MVRNALLSQDSNTAVMNELLVHNQIPNSSRRKKHRRTIVVDGMAIVHEADEAFVDALLLTGALSVQAGREDQQRKRLHGEAGQVP